MSVKDRSCFRAALPADLLFTDSWMFMRFMFTHSRAILVFIHQFLLFFLLQAFSSTCKERRTVKSMCLGS